MSKTIILFLIASVLLISVTGTPCFAENNSKNIKQVSTLSDIETIIKSIGSLLGEAAKAASMGLEEFSKTPYGKLLWWYLLFKLIIFSVWKIIGGILFVAFIDYMLWKYTIKFFIGVYNYTTNADGVKVITYTEEPYDFASGDARATLGATFVCIGMIANLIILPIIMFK